MRETVRVEVTEEWGESRDRGKIFLITEMDAWDAEAWGERAFGVMVRAGLKVPENQRIIGGMAAIGVYGLASFLSGPWDEVQPLLKEMIDKCVRIWEPAIPVGRVLTRDDIEEPITIVRLREEAIKLHTGFSLAGSTLSAVFQAMEWMDSRSTSPPIPTFPSISASSSVRERLRLRSYRASIPLRTPITSST